MDKNRFFWIWHGIIRAFGMMRHIRLGIRYRLILPMDFHNAVFKVPFFGYEYEGNLKDYIDRYVYYFGAYEREELMFLKKFISKDFVILDIGANTGHHSLFFSRYAEQVYSFEPYEKMFERLQQRVLHNDIKNITCLNMGIGDKDEMVDFFAPSELNGGVGTFIPDGKKIKVGKLQIRKGDGIINELGISKVDLIKIDVEGMETEVLNGLEETIMRTKPVIFAEMNAASQVKLDIEFRKKFNFYDFYVIDANNPILFLFNKPGCQLKKFVPSNNMENILWIPSDKNIRVYK